MTTESVRPEHEAPRTGGEAHAKWVAIGLLELFRFAATLPESTPERLLAAVGAFTAHAVADVAGRLRVPPAEAEAFIAGVATMYAERLREELPRLLAEDRHQGERDT